MKTYAYVRVSTEKQKFNQQLNAINDFIKVKGYTIDEIYEDEGVSGSVSYKDRKLYELIRIMKEGDLLIVSELSRLGRSMYDVNKLVHEELKTRKLRLAIVSMGIFLDCANMKAIDELILTNFSFSAQVEKEMIQERTREAIDAIKKEIAEKGFHISKKGRACTKLGNSSDTQKATAASVKSRRTKAQNNPNNKSFWEFIELWEAKHGRITANTDFEPIANELNKRGKVTSSGLCFNKLRARAMYVSVKRIYEY